MFIFDSVTGSKMEQSSLSGYFLLNDFKLRKVKQMKTVDDTLVIVNVIKIGFSLSACYSQHKVQTVKRE